MDEQIQSGKNNLTMGAFASFLLSFFTIIAFGFAMTAIPPSGAYCPQNCMSYPFPDILAYYPRDYYWMYVSIIQLFVFVVFMVANHFIANASLKIYTFLGISFALISTTVLLLAYFTQFSVVPVSVMNNETEGIALITQYNEHGLFIAMEELGYITMSVSLFFLAFAFSDQGKLSRAIRFILLGQLVLNLLAFVFYAVAFGIHRGYRFEVATITINWITLILIGILIGIHQFRSLKSLKI